MARASEKVIKKYGEEIFKRMKGEIPSVFDKNWWSGKIMDLSMKDEAFKVEMFRFVDVFPTLKNSVQIAEHLQEYFCRPEQNFPASFQWGLAKVSPDSKIARIAASQIEKQIRAMAVRFIAGTDVDEALPTLREMWDSDISFTLDLLGEEAVSAHESSQYAKYYEGMLDVLNETVPKWPYREKLESAASYGVVPRINISIKLSALFSQLDPANHHGSMDAIKAQLRPIFRKAKTIGAFINLDAEQYHFKDLTYDIFKSILEEDEFCDYPHFGIVAQAYLKDCANDLEALAKWAKKRKTPITVRLVKGAYWDYEVIHSKQQGWSCPVFEEKWQTDQSYERCTELLLDHHKSMRTAIASHNVRSIAHAMAYADALRLDKRSIEFQMLYGMAEPMKAAISSMGYRLRDYVPVGEVIPGMAYLVRRLLENTSNESWLKNSFVEKKSLELLLGKPSPPTERTIAHSRRADDECDEFQNEPLLDFAVEGNRMKMAQALQTTRSKFGQNYPIIVGTKRYSEEEFEQKMIASVNPAQKMECVGSVPAGTIKVVDEAVEVAAKTQPAWAQQTIESRAGVLRRCAQKLRDRRFELCAWIILEVGKGWHEADAEVCEAIDFCEYYASKMEQLGQPERLGHLPGELNLLTYDAVGVAAIIAPWNFPLAILAGMTVAALVAGNTVVIKPAEQSSVIAAHFIQALFDSGVPEGVVNVVYGYGEEVGRALVTHPKVNIIAFTGSREVGLEIIDKAGKTQAGQGFIKRVISEMGGKNAIIVDADADIDAAIQGVVSSAFGFQGQKCSACSRVIVHESCYPEFVDRLCEAAKSLVMGSPHDPANRFGPVIDSQALDKIKQYVEIGRTEGTVLLDGMKQTLPQGYFIGPTIIADITPEHRLAQEEIFGPVLAIMKVSSFEQALAYANSTLYALTGGVYSRSPANIEKAQRSFDVGNLYINRTITGALVYRNPFGGYRLSGTGIKAGGADYLKHFLKSRVVVENTMRRGFAPSE